MQKIWICLLYILIISLISKPLSAQEKEIDKADKTTEQTEPKVKNKKAKNDKNKPKAADLSLYSKVSGKVNTRLLPAFVNVNTKKKIDNKHFREKAMKLEKNEDENNLLKLLQEYVQKFTVSDFKHNSYWIWRLAQIYEKNKKIKLAKEWYKVAIKHKPKNMNFDRLLKHYDSLTVNDKDYYVSLKYYYKLVEARNAVDTLKAPRSVYTNMGRKINSDSSDYAPTISSDDNYLIFTSRRHLKKGVKGQNIANEDLFISQRFNSNEYSDAIGFNEVNTKYNEGSACFSKDGKVLIFSRCFAPDAVGHCDLYETKKDEKGKWSKPTNLGIANSTLWDSHPSLSHSGDTLYFASNRKERSFGREDIYYSVRQKNNTWGEAMNLGPTINTSGREISPFIHYNHNLLYFSSDRQLVNFGGFDIYKAYITGINKENKMIKFSEPLNIGPLVNEKTNEYYFTIDANSNDLFYAKSVKKNSKNLDLFTFPLPMEAQPDAIVTVKGSFKDKENVPFQGVVSVLDLDHGVEVTPKFLRPDGSFSFNLINGRKYLIIINGEDFFRFEDLFFLSGSKNMEYTAERLSKIIEFSDIEFDYNSADLKDNMLLDISKVVDFLIDNPDFYLVVRGHTDERGDKDVNLKLSQHRADNIIDYIELYGNIDKSRLKAIGFGSSKPIIKNAKTEEDRALNRRVEFELIQEKE